MERSQSRGFLCDLCVFFANFAIKGFFLPVRSSAATFKKLSIAKITKETTVFLDVILSGPLKLSKVKVSYFSFLAMQCPGRRRWLLY